MKSQDIVILLKKITKEGKNLSLRGLAVSLGMSPSSVSESLKRCQKAKLVDHNKQNVNILSLQEFLIHGLQYVFPVEAGRIVRGVPTYINASPMNELLTNSGESYVWHFAKGTVRGQKVEPLYPSVPDAALLDEELYELLVLVDTLRLGRAREIEIAKEELEKRFIHYANNK